MTHIRCSRINLKVKGSLLLKGLVASAFLPRCKETWEDKGSCKAGVALHLLIVPCGGKLWGPSSCFKDVPTFNHANHSCLVYGVGYINKAACYCQSNTKTTEFRTKIVYTYFHIKRRIHLRRLSEFGKAFKKMSTVWSSVQMMSKYNAF